MSVTQDMVDDAADFASKVSSENERERIVALIRGWALIIDTGRRKTKAEQNDVIIRFETLCRAATAIEEGVNLPEGAKAAHPIRSRCASCDVGLCACCGPRELCTDCEPEMKVKESGER